MLRFIQIIFYERRKNMDKEDFVVILQALNELKQEIREGIEEMRKNREQK